MPGISMELIVRLSDGSFDSRVCLPTEAKEHERKAVVEAWFELMKKAIHLADSVKRDNEPEVK